MANLQTLSLLSFPLGNEDIEEDKSRQKFRNRDIITNNGDYQRSGSLAGNERGLGEGVYTLICSTFRPRINLDGSHSDVSDLPSSRKNEGEE